MTFFLIGQTPCVNLFGWSDSSIHTGLLSYLCRSCGQGAYLELLLSGATSSLICTRYHQLSNMHCPLGPYVPAVMTCLSAVQAPCPTKPHHTTSSAPQQAARHLQQ